MPWPHPIRAIPTTLDQPLEDFTAATKGGSIEGMRHRRARLQASCRSSCDPDVVQAWQSAARTFESLGATVEAVRLPSWFFEMAQGAGTISTSEMFSLHRDWIEDKTKAIGPRRARPRAARQEFRDRRLCRGAAPHEQRRAEFTEWMQPYDAPAGADGRGARDPAVGSRRDVAGSGYLTRPGNYLGLCALSMPSGFSGGLPLGIQIVGKPYAERDVLKLGKAFQDATDFHRRARSANWACL